MKRTILSLALGFIALVSQAQQVDTLHLSTLYTTHVIFPTEVIYADLSNNQSVAAKIGEQNKNMLAVKARTPFNTTTSVSALESNGNMHTFVIVFDEHPSALVIDLRKNSYVSAELSRGKRQGGGNDVSLVRESDAPMLSEIVKDRQRVFHIGDRKYDVTSLCEDIFVYSDNTYIVLSVGNRSGVSYETGDATFVIESRKKNKRSVQYEKNLFPKGRYGSLTAKPGSVSRIAYSFDKVTLTKDQVLKVYLYETDGQRNLVMTLSARDINKAKRASH